MNKLLTWFFSTSLGGLYFELLLWIDRKKSNPTKYLTPKEMAQIVRESNKTYEGVSKVKKKVNELINSRSSEEYHKALSELEDLTKLSTHEENSSQARFSKLLRSTYDLAKNRDIITHTDKAKMIDKRIQDMRELWDDKNKRQLLRGIRQARIEGNTQLADKLQTEFNNKYGRSSTRFK